MFKYLNYSKSGHDAWNIGLFITNGNKEDQPAYRQCRYNGHCLPEKRPEYFGFLNFFRCTKANRGSLLLEVLLAIVILSTSLILIIQSFVSSLRAMVYSGDYSTAAFLLDSKMFDVLHSQFVQSGQGEGVFPKPFDKYRYTMKIQRSESDDSENMINEINVDIIWVSGMKEKRISAVTYVLDLPQT